ncbi:MAG TPA: hypothetical protein HA254_01120 [Candidatus Diapherotrites archaeon]|uniref:Uncharacterized protein n=1 Tax=Candidatus Iainarchaeum sp. TaxID=3101447 RepID=A0A7J4IUR0_9ARCH|nr:hypothetical protein [Candidatus Diapherotrites archaeon]
MAIKGRGNANLCSPEVALHPAGCKAMGGQAAVTDAMYFILIVTFLSVFLFGFANTYGDSVREQISDEYNKAFATNALKVILYSSIPRDTLAQVQDGEVDFLLALIKEDYSDDGVIGGDERKVLGRAISSILSPIQDTTDYMFYITIPDQKKFVFIYLHLTEFEKVPYSASLKPASSEKGKFYIYKSVKDDPSSPQDDSHLDFFCSVGADDSGSDALLQDIGYDELMAKVTRLVTNVGPTSQASSSIKLVRESANKTFDKTGDFRAQADLILWDAIWLDKTDERPAELFPYKSPSAWNCISVQ